MAASTVNTNKPIIPRGVDDRPVDKYNRAELYSGKALDFDGVNDYVTVLYGYNWLLYQMSDVLRFAVYSINKTTAFNFYLVIVRYLKMVVILFVQVL